MKKLIIIVAAIFIAVLGGLFIYSSFFQKRVSNLPTATPISSVSENKEDIPLLSTVASNLEVPWSLVFLPDKSILFTERVGKIRLIDSNGNLLSEPIATLNQVKQIGEGGLLGIELDPSFSTNHNIYIYYTFNGSNNQTLNRVAKAKFENNKISDLTTIVDNIPGSNFHNGGRIKFGPDGFLYITTGDSENPSLAQNKNSLAGKILRVTSDGRPAPGNPFGNEVYSYGHRNPQGLAWDSNGSLWATEHGRSGAQSGLDELNLIEKGKNYGWPTIQGDQTKPGMETPKINSGPTTTWAPAGAAFLNGSIFFGGLRGQTLYEAVLDNGNIKLKKHLEDNLGRIRDVVLGPDNMLYITTSNRDGRGIPNASDDKIIRVKPAKL